MLRGEDLKLSIIYQHKDSANRETIDSIIAQMTDDCELIIATQSKGSLFSKYKMAAEGKKVRAVKQEANKPLDFKNALKVAQGEYIAFVFEDDGVDANYVETILKRIEGGDADYYPIKWRFVNWHNFTFNGNVPIAHHFANIYKTDVAKKIKEDGTIKGVEKLKSGAPINTIIYLHWS